MPFKNEFDKRYQNFRSCKICKRNIEYLWLSVAFVKAKIHINFPKGKSGKKNQAKSVQNKAWIKYKFKSGFQTFFSALKWTGDGSSLTTALSQKLTHQLQLKETLEEMNSLSLYSTSDKIDVIKTTS